MEKTEKFREERYPTIPLLLKDPLTQDNLRKVLEQTYVNMVNDFTGSSGKNNLVIIDRAAILPTIIALILFAILWLLKPLFNFISFIVAGLVWAILKWTGFTKIEVETVEAEVVSI
jgi:hypothetical protein